MQALNNTSFDAFICVTDDLFESRLLNQDARGVGSARPL